MFYREVRENNCGIYVIKNTKNGKMYVGQSHNITWRWMSHRSALRAGRCVNRHLQSAWNKYGESSFAFSILELCSIEDLDSREEYWIKCLNTNENGYNIRSGGSSSRGWKMDDDGRRHISEALKGKKKPEGTGQRISERVKHYYKTHIPVTSVSVVCLNTEEVFENAKAAHKKYQSADVSAIHKQCKGKSRSCGKMDSGERLVWAYWNDYAKMSQEEINTRLSFVGFVASATNCQKPVRCLETGEIFNSCTAAATYAGVSKASMYDCLHGRSGCAGRHPKTGERLSWAWAS